MIKQIGSPPSGSLRIGLKIRPKDRDSLAQGGKSAPAEQIPLFGGVEPEPASRRVVVNPHLLAARRLARKMRQLPDRSIEETRAGLAICRQLKAYLQDREDGKSVGTNKPQPRH